MTTPPSVQSIPETLTRVLAVSIDIRSFPPEASPAGPARQSVPTPRCVGLLALIAGTVSYVHMHLLVELHGQPGWVAALTPLSVDGMIVAASTTLLADSRACGR